MLLFFFSVNGKPQPSADQASTIDNKNIAAKTFTFRELAAATKNFRQECLLGEGGFGRVYKGTLQSSGEVIEILTLIVLNYLALLEIKT